MGSIRKELSRGNIARAWRRWWRDFKGTPAYTPAPAVAPPITHKVETKWTPISHNEPLRKSLRKTCGFVPPTPGYAPCTREPHSSGPCAHPLTQEPTWTVTYEPIEPFATIDALAQQLHREYRAASKALKGTAKHDHGWKHCRKKSYFWKRARQWRRDSAEATKG